MNAHTDRQEGRQADKKQTQAHIQVHKHTHGSTHIFAHQNETNISFLSQSDFIALVVKTI